MNQAIQRAEAEGRLIVFPNGRYKYTPSQEYIAKFQKVIPLRREVRKAVDKIDRLVEAMDNAYLQDRVVVDCCDGIIRTRAKY